ncbi:Kinesin-like protein [Plasmodiophora brassicae]
MRSREARFESLFWEDYLLISESGGAVKHRRTLLESRRMLPKPKPVAERLAEMQKRPARGATAKRPRSGNENIELDRHTRLKTSNDSVSSKKPPVPSASAAPKKRLTPQELREKLSEVRTKLKDATHDVQSAQEQVSRADTRAQEAEERIRELKDLNSAAAATENELRSTIKKLTTTCDEHATEIESLKQQVVDSEKANAQLITANEELSRDKQTLQRQVDDLESSKQTLSEQIAALNEKVTTLQTECEGLCTKVSSGLELVCSLQQDLFMKSAQLTAAQSVSETQAGTIARLTSECKQHQERIEELVKASHEAEARRRELHNQVQELKGNIRVFCRVRPTVDGSAPASLSFTDLDTIEIKGRSDVSLDGSSSSRRQHVFTFDRVFNPASKQDDVWQEISQLCTSAIDGYKVVVFAYGQTGSGKTYTMEGPPASMQTDERGMIPRAISQIFSRAAQLAERHWTYKCTGESSDDADLKIKHNVDGSTTVVGAAVEPVASEAEVFPLLSRAARRRSVAKTKLNDRSSRSHSIFQMTIYGHNSVSGQDTVGVLNLVDLAGSERLKKSDSQGDTLKETQAINKSLSSLGDVIAALANGSKHVPYRNSKLTYLLQNCFGGDSKCLMFVSVSPEEENVHESLCSLRFASKVNSCHIGTARRSVKQSQ